MRITDEHLEHVAEVYTRAARAGRPPTEAVWKILGGGRSTAERWVMSARAKGFLPVTSQGKATGLPLRPHCETCTCKGRTGKPRSWTGR